MSKIVELYKDAKALATDLVTAPFIAPREMYRALRNGYDILGTDMKAPSVVEVPAQKIVNTPRNAMVSTLSVVGTELFKASLGIATGGILNGGNAIVGFDLQNAIIGATAGGLICKTVMDWAGAAMCDSYAGTGTASMPKTQLRKQQKAVAQKNSFGG
jgi:hypothetical protein